MVHQNNAVVVSQYNNIDIDDEIDCDPEESFESKEGGCPVGRTQPLIGNPISFIDQEIIFIIPMAVTVMMITICNDRSD